MKYRKKSIVIEAIRVRETLNRPRKQWPEWLRAAQDNGTVLIFLDTVHIHTREGTMVANWGDWIIQGVKGELYPCKPDIFAATYEPVLE